MLIVFDTSQIKSGATIVAEYNVDESGFLQPDSSDPTLPNMEVVRDDSTQSEDPDVEVLSDSDEGSLTQSELYYMNDDNQVEEVGNVLLEELTQDPSTDEAPQVTESGKELSQ